MSSPSEAPAVRHCRLGDVAALSRLLKASWHSTHDAILGSAEAARIGGRVYSKLDLWLRIAQSRLSGRWTSLVATLDGTLVGHAMAHREDTEIVLYMLYVHPQWQGRGAGSALLSAVIAEHAGAKAIRLEVLKDNARAVGWYKSRGFEIYGDTARATGTANHMALYMDKQLESVSAGPRLR